MSDFLLRFLSALSDPSALADATMKASLLLGVALTLGHCAHRLSPALRFWIVTLSILSLPFIVALSFFGPGPRFSWFSGRSVAGAGAPVVMTAEAPPEPLIAAGVYVAPAAPVDAAETAIDWPLTAVAVWLGGMAFLATWQLGRSFSKRMRRSRLPDWPDPRIGAELERIAKRTGWGKAPRLVVADGWTMPATWGWRNPTILLPREAENWPASRLRHVLWHEMAHIARRDALTEMLSRWAALFLWFHPLVALSRRLASRLREAACDDLVLTQGNATAADYSDDLLTIVRRHFQPKPRENLAMARSSDVGSRVRRLLDVGAVRQSPSWTARVLTAGLWIALSAGVSLSLSCRSPRPLWEDATNAPRRLTVSGKARHAARTVRFGVVALSVPQGEDSPFRTLMREQSSRDAVAVESLAWLAGQKGADLIASGEVLEGQTLDLSEGSLNARFTGERSEDGRTVVTTATLQARKPTPLGGTRTYDVPMASFHVPNGGFVLFPRAGHGRIGVRQNPIADLFSGGEPEVIVGIFASSDPLPETARTAAAPTIRPGDARFPSGQKLVAVEVKLFSKPRSASWPVKLPPSSHPGVAAGTLAKMLSVRDVTAVHYPRTLTFPDRNVTIRNVVNKPMLSRDQKFDAAGKPIVSVEYAAIGTVLDVLPSLAKNGRLVLNSRFSHSSIVGDEIDPAGNRHPVVSTQKLDSEIALPPGQDTVFLGEVQAAGKDGTDTAVFITAKTVTND